uniref:UBC core domain-containing protein n=1 Tax=Coccolithus braarudii TaxID=221442 RepID=A0A7S0LS53_9EUKA|mmetsp:Transcript_7452/g.16328  ORF Transcript_7452/g.16328 Transcript_7452/m.16328 type:complete len:175 (+) Transcript_7452:106-630(+)
MSAAEERLRNERKAWRKDRPDGFIAKPASKSDGTNDLFKWELKIPAKIGSVWAPGLFSATMTFESNYPERPPAVSFHKIDGQVLFHPNIYPNGGVCLSIINPPESSHGYGKGGTWKPDITIKKVLLALQTFLDEPNVNSPAQQEAYRVYVNDRAEYDRRVKGQVALVERSSLAF